MNVTEAVLVGAFIGVLVGAVAVLVGSRRAAMSDREHPTADEPATGATALPAEVVAVLGALRAGSVVVDGSGSVLWASASVRAWGLVDDLRITDDRVGAAVRATRSTQEPGSLELEPRRRRGGARVLLSVRTTMLDADRTLVLVEDRSQAARVDEVRRDFVANVSHELKTPVGALSLLAEAVEGAADDPEAVQRFAARMRHEAARLTAMVNDLIELSRLQGDDLADHAGPVAVDAVVADALDFVRTRAHARSIELRATGKRGLVVHGDQSQLTTALRNLLDNAVSYSPERTRVVVDVRAVRGQVEISVADQGIGISEVDQARIFERFYRVDPARSRATGGTGLGLAIVRHVCVNHGGEVTVWSTEGAGSTFTLRLPVDAGPRPVPPVQHNGSAAVPSSPTGPQVRRAVP